MVLFAATVLVTRRWRSSVPELGPKSSTPREWEEYKIMDGLRARAAVPLLGSATIGRHALAATLLLTSAALTIWTYYNWVN